MAASAALRPRNSADATIGTVHAVAVRFDLHVPESRSLKAKRAAIRPVDRDLLQRYFVDLGIDSKVRTSRVLETETSAS